MTYKIQIDDLVRDATPEEVAEIEARALEAIKAQEALEAKASARAELLQRIGITEEEAKILFG